MSEDRCAFTVPTYDIYFFFANYTMYGAAYDSLHYYPHLYLENDSGKEKEYSSRAVAFLQL